MKIGHIAYADGGCPYNGVAASSMYGSYKIFKLGEGVDRLPLIKDLVDQTPLIEDLRCNIQYTGGGGHITNNCAEILSLHNLLNRLIADNLVSPGNGVVVFMDSQLVVNQMIGAYKVKQDHLRQLYKKIQMIFKKYETRYGCNLWEELSLQWISGEDMKKILGH